MPGISPESVIVFSSADTSRVAVLWVLGLEGF